jgi:hypothetical protein
MQEKKAKSPLLAPTAAASQHFGDVLDAAPSTPINRPTHSQTPSNGVDASRQTDLNADDLSPLSLDNTMLKGPQCVIAPELADQFTAPERLALTANGNLQRILSGWHDSSVSVRVISNALTSTSSKGKTRLLG